jgi:hypothetical protein
MKKKLLLLSLVLVLAGALGVVALSAQGRTVPINASLSGEIITIGDGPGLFDVNL